MTSFASVTRLLAHVSILLLAHVAAAPASVHTNSVNSTSCTEPYTRKEWRRLSADQRIKYISAVKCMMNKPALTPASIASAAQSRYDDFIATHIVETLDVHFVGRFYPYHRLLVASYEKELWACGWDTSLGQPFWDWTIDTQSEDAFFNSPLFDNVTGFGGDGPYVSGNYSDPAPGLTVNTPWDVPDRKGGGCLTSGPFANHTTYLGPQNNTVKGEPHCLRRDFSYGSLLNMSGEAMVQEAMDLPDYGWLEYTTDTSSIHPGGHWGIGGLYGTMTDLYASPADPIFWLHHSNLDRFWWSWQSRDLDAREHDISGPLVYMDYTNLLGGNATLDTIVWAGLADNVSMPIREVMHIQKGALCYTFNELY